MIKKYSGGEKMVRGEMTGRRDLTYSGFHRTLASYCYMTDLDFVEYRPERGIIAIGEAKLWNGRLTPFQKSVLDDLVKETPYSIFVIWYKNPISDFKVLDWRTKKVTLFTEQEFRAWIEAL